MPLKNPALKFGPTCFFASSGLPKKGKPEEAKGAKACSMGQKTFCSVNQVIFNDYFLLITINILTFAAHMKKQKLTKLK